VPARDSTVPEPSTLILLSLGVLAMCGRRNYVGSEKAQEN